MRFYKDFLKNTCTAMFLNISLQHKKRSLTIKTDNDGLLKHAHHGNSQEVCS